MSPSLRRRNPHWRRPRTCSLQAGSWSQWSRSKGLGWLLAAIGSMMISVMRSSARAGPVLCGWNRSWRVESNRKRPSADLAVRPPESPISLPSGTRAASVRHCSPTAHLQHGPPRSTGGHRRACGLAYFSKRHRAHSTPRSEAGSAQRIVLLGVPPFIRIAIRRLRQARTPKRTERWRY